jgi:pimeloyl-ACP methyl ester carboxylesterase
MQWLLVPVVLFMALGKEGKAQSPHPIGFADTLLFNDSLRYTGSGYDGPAPLFVQAWFPIEEQTTARLTYRQLRERHLTGPLQRVHQELLSRADSAFIEYDLRYPFDGDDPIDYTPYSEWQVKDSLFALRPSAFAAAWPERLDRPVIVYHHGAQGFSDENVALAESFARLGFVFLSCNFHWPLEDRPYGFPIEWKPDRQSIRTMLRFARALARGNKVFYIGHSWGAQEGWCTLHELGLVDAFISLETTMEWKTDTAEVHDKWPFVLKAITTHSYPMPILMVADTEGEPPFPMFKGVHGDLRYLDPKTPFGHESYTSAYLLRLHGRGRFPVPDAEELLVQNTLHAELSRELLYFLWEQVEWPALPPVLRDDDPFHRYPPFSPTLPTKR